MTDFKRIIKFRSTISDEQNETINKSILLYGKQRQLLCFVEELGELLQELNKNDDIGIQCTEDTLIEIADVVVAVEDIKQVYLFSTSEFDIDVSKTSLRESITNMLIGISHYERDRIDDVTYKGLIIKLYTSIEEFLDHRFLQDDYIWEKMNLILDEKFEKFKTQIDKEMKNV